MAGRSASASITRYAGIQVQTSALGLNVPVGWGTFRCKCNLVDYLDFKSKSQKAAAAKGGATTGYSYSATVVLALCEGPIDSVSTIYVDGKVYKNGAKTALAQANLNLHTGAIGQPVWSYLTSNHPAHAIGYSGLAIAYQSNYALDSSAQTPNHSFEVVRVAGFGVAGSPDADPSLIVSDFFNNSRYGVPSWAPGLLGDLTAYQTYCLAAGLLVSPVIDSQRSASDFLTELLRATNSTCVWSEGLLKFIPYGDTPLSGNGRSYVPANTPVYALGDDDYIPQSAGEDPLTIDIQDQSDAYNVVQLEYLDRTNEYNMAIALASDAANVAQYGPRRKDPDTVHCIAAPAVAALSAQLYLQRTLYIRAQFKFTLGWQFALLEPGDILELTDTALGLNAYPVRIIQIDDDEDACRAIIAEDFPVGVSHSPLYTMQTGAAASRDTNIDPGGVEANLLLWSDDPSQTSVWGQAACAVSAVAGDDQYGLPTARYIVPTAVSGGHFLYQGFAAFPGAAYTYSVCLAQGAHRYVMLQLSDFIANDSQVVFDLAAGVIVSEANGGSAVLIGASISATLVAGIWRCVITVQIPAATTLYTVCAVLDAAQNFNWTGDGSNAVAVMQQAVRQGVDPGVYAATGASAAGPVLFNPPAALNDGGSSIFAAVAGGPNWGGCNVWVSIDGTDFEEIGTIDTAARFGRLTAALPSHADPDAADTLSVDLGWSGAQLTGASTASADNGATNSWIGGEMVAFSAATLTNPSRYELTGYLRRGFMNTPVAAHAAGDLFVRLDASIFDFPYFDVNTGQTIYVKFQSFNLYGHALQDLSDCVTYSVIPNPVAANAPGASAFTASAATLSAAGVVVPVLEIAGAVDNPGAAALLVFYRNHGAGAWVPAGTYGDASTVAYIATVVSGQAYDVGVAYLVSGVQTGITQIGTNITVAGAVAPAIVGQAPAATDGSIQIGATKNITTYSPTAPTSPTDGDFWVDTAVTPNITYLHAGGVWQAAANHVTGTSQITDDALLGHTAVWSSVSATPANLTALTGTEAINNATLQAALTAGAVVPATAASIPASNVSGLAAAATDGSIQAGATNNTIYTQPSDPTLSPYGLTVINGAIWINASTGTAYLRIAGSWVVFGSYASGALLFTGALSGGSWTVPSSYPNATLKLALTGGDGGQNFSGSHSGGSGDSCAVIVDVVPGATVITYSVGAGGAQGVGGAPFGTAGGDTTAHTTGAYNWNLDAGGGAGATNASDGAGGVFSSSGTGIVSATDTPGAAGAGASFKSGSFKIYAT